MLRFLPVKSVLIVSAFCSGALATDWTEFRGPNGQGHADFQDLPVTWSETENVAWKVPVSGIGWSSPVVSAGRIFLTTAVEDSSEHSLRVISLDAASGKEQWNVEVFRQAGDVKMHSKNSHASPTAIVEGDRLFVHFGPHGTACLTIDGDIEWKNDKLTYAPVHGNGGSPAISGNVMIICCDGSDNRFVVGLDKNTGKEVWRTERELDPSRGFSFSTPTIINAEGRSMAICPGSGGVWAYDPESGKQLWRVAYGEGYSVVPRPVFGHGLVYVCSGFGDGQLIAIDPTGSGDVTESHVKWKTKKGVPKSPSVLLVGDEIYMVDDKGIATCLDAVSGKQHWQERLGGGFSASPTYADGRIYFQNETGETTVVRPGTKYEEIAKNKIGDGKLRTFASFAFVDNAILLRNETHLYRLQKTEAAGQ
ncbi:PQQ-binding-like beta-propeller repeat protein [Fuerstiella marisgermanici]|uniref:Outer membrane biogenesis protein n=1 Tax=Fuerstiella marisgermanici TaxID=1891926 RepID=A0A1P8WAT7_9PLAN|nr:PQQ-binding-like beta-propeller repeat protein [Fuerstiella marisgermanici]APZ91180.1 outer membrane biogenesis protein [Fuerstiella marisgermanici]